MQDALLRTFSRCRSGTNVDAIEPYLKRAILNRHVDQARRRSRLESVKHLLVSPATTGRFEPAIGEQHAIRAALASLPGRQRAAVVLRFYDDLPVAEIAQVMGCSPGAIKRYLSDATCTWQSDFACQKRGTRHDVTRSWPSV